MKHSLAVVVLAGIGAFGCSSDKGPLSKTHGSSKGAKDDVMASADSGTDAGGIPYAWDECGLNTGYAGDDRCILPPPPDKGLQIHFGPDDYDNPDALSMLAPGEERTDNIPATSTNDHDVYFFFRQYRLRPSAHHIIVTAANGSGDILTGRRIATANTSQDYPAHGIIAPEDQHVGSPLAAHAAVNASFHAINTTDQPQLREAWINFWYRDPSEVTEPATEWFETGNVALDVPPHTSTTLGPYTCNIDNTGRVLWLYGHRHANNTRFTVSRVRGAQHDVIYDADNWEEPLLLDYNSLEKNPAPDIPNGIEGGWSGILDVMAGDQIQWQCDVTNNHDTDLRFTEQTFLGEMCIVDAEAVGANCNGGFF